MVVAMPEIAPVFPLNSVLFPGGVLPLRIFETRYIDMVSRCLRDGRGFVIALIDEGKETGGDATVCSTGTLVSIAEWNTTSDGLLGITAQGQQKVAIGKRSIGADRLMTAAIEPLEAEALRDLPPEFIHLAELLEKILTGIGSPFNQLETVLDDSAWVAGRLTEVLPIPLQSKQMLLEMDDPLSRLHALHDQMLTLKIV